MKKNFYLQHSLMAMNDPRMHNLIETEGLKGCGAYWYIIEKLELLPEPRASLEYLQPYCKSRIVTLSYLKKIIFEYNLFIIEEDGFFMPDELNPTRENGRNMSESVRKSTKNRQKGDGNLQKLSKNKAERQANLPNKSLKTNDLQETIIDFIKENINDIITTATKEEETEAVADADIPPIPPTEKPSMLSGADDYHRPSHSPQPIHPWQKLVDDLTQDSEWVDIACMRSGYGALMKMFFKDAVKFFKQHILTYDKGGELLDMKAVHQYFINFASPGSRTSKELYKYLENLSKKQRADSPDPYRFEKKIDGRRTYLGCPIPDNAPPRPDETAIWNTLKCVWISKKQ